MFNKGMGNISKQAQKMQKNINNVQDELKNMIFIASQSIIGDAET